ncbi:hypothetical protein STEG23_004640 [Scotinomys teguina]
MAHQRQEEEELPEEWIRKMWFIYTMEYYAAEKSNDIMKFAGKWMELENVILSEMIKNLWIASRLILFNQPRPPDKTSDAPTTRSATSDVDQRNRIEDLDINPHSIFNASSKVKLTSTTAPCIAETQTASHSILLKNLITTVPPLTLNTVISTIKDAGKCFQCIQQSKVDENNSTLHRRNTSCVSFNSTREVDKNSASSYIQHSPFNKKRRDVLLHSVESMRGKCFQCIQQSKVDENNSTLHRRNTSCVSFNSTREVDKNSDSSYIQHSPFNKKRRNVLLHSVESIEGKVSIVSLARTKEPCIIETRRISHSTPFEKLIRTVPPLASNTLIAGKYETCL